MSDFNAIWTAEIAHFRHLYITDATRRAVNADQPADVIAQVAHKAGLRWAEEHPTLASRMEVSV